MPRVGHHDSIHVDDESFALPETDTLGDGYLDAEAKVELTLRAAADAIHPGYGFKLENPGFARACQKARGLS